MSIANNVQGRWQFTTKPLKWQKNKVYQTCIWQRAKYQNRKDPYLTKNITVYVINKEACISFHLV